MRVYPTQRQISLDKLSMGEISVLPYDQILPSKQVSLRLRAPLPAI